MTNYVQHAPKCLVEHYEEKKEQGDQSESTQILKRLLTYQGMERVWEALGVALNKYEQSLKKLVNNVSEAGKSHANELHQADIDLLDAVKLAFDIVPSDTAAVHDGSMSDASYFILWKSICDVMNDAKTVNTTPAQTRKAIEKTLSSINELTKDLRENEILRRASDSFTWEIARSWIEYPDNMSKPVYLKNQQEKIDQVYEHSVGR